MPVVRTLVEVSAAAGAGMEFDRTSERTFFGITVSPLLKVSAALNVFGLTMPWSLLAGARSGTPLSGATPGTATAGHNVFALLMPWSPLAGSHNAGSAMQASSVPAYATVEVSSGTPARLMIEAIYLSDP